MRIEIKAPRVCVHAHFCAGVVFAVQQHRTVILLPCSHTVLLCFWLILLCDSVCFIPEDNVKSSQDTYSAVLPQHFLITEKNLLSKIPTVCSIQRLLLPVSRMLSSALLQ